MSKLTRIHSRKDFINKPYFHSDGSIFSQIYLNRYHGGVDINTVLKIRDCDRVIHLSINPGSTKEELTNSLFKLDTIIDHLQELREKLEHGFYVRKELDKIEKEKRKKDAKGKGKLSSNN